MSFAYAAFGIVSLLPIDYDQIQISGGSPDVTTDCQSYRPFYCNRRVVQYIPKAPLVI
ncbi:hypothetical protein ACRALDRAFT_2016579 [Sodiomyces alcalophilus JCM 7366]|uniref:uncharacterized protein n=1 Tax=Sodiomyces alcalophilus JCM 7366 TaxID=591952 RepID=UPI0039B4FF85